MSTHVMIDIESLGNNNDSQVLSIGACVFNRNGVVARTFYRVISLAADVHVNATPSTLEFWLDQGDRALFSLLTDKDSKPEAEVLAGFAKWLEAKGDDVEVWANGTKFDLSTLESLFKKHGIPVPWGYNADRCMRTLRRFAGNLDIDFNGRPHHALDDAIWQAKYVAAACERLGLAL